MLILRKGGSAVILNLSNHPHLNWPEKQLREAQGYGDVIDLPFPPVSPDATEEELEQTALGPLLPETAGSRPDGGKRYPGTERQDPRGRECSRRPRPGGSAERRGKNPYRPFARPDNRPPAPGASAPYLRMIRQNTGSRLLSEQTAGGCFMAFEV